MTADKLRVGIVGCGYQGGRLVEAIGLSDSLVVAACADPVTEAAATLANKVGHATSHDSVDDLLGQADVDVVMVATPHHVLADVSIKAIRAGKHVLAEKPVALNEREVDRVQDALAVSGVCYLAGYSFRNLPAWTQAHDLLAAGAVGEISGISGRFGVTPLNNGWIADPETGGGPLLFVGSHLIDQVLWYSADEPVEVFADMRCRADTGADETTAFQIAFGRGLVAQCQVTQAALRMTYGLEVIGRGGTLSIRSAGYLSFEISVHSTVLEQYKEPTVIRPVAAGDARNVMHLAQFETFVDAIRNQRPAAVTLDDARKVLRVTDAIFASDRAGVPVNLS
jgi:predicted dehydrogenase